MKTYEKTGKCLILAAAAVLLFHILISCSAADRPMKDGYYSAEAAEFDSRGWKEYVSICVSNGRIILVEYNAFNASGFVRSWDVNFMRGMNDENGVYPNAYTRYYGERLLLQQGTNDISHLSGATHSYHIFLKLAETVLHNARQGNTETSLVSFDGSTY